MSTLGRAVIEFAADTAKFTGDVGRAVAQFDRGMARMNAAVTAFRNAAVAAASLGGVGVLIGRATEAGERLNKMSQSLGHSVEFLSAFQHSARLADVDIEGMSLGLREFNKSMAEANDTNSKSARIFAALGVDISKGPQVAIEQFAEQVSKLADGETKTALATAIMGRQGDKLIPVLNQGAEGFKRAAEQARNLGILIGPDFAEKAEKFNDNLKTLGTMTDALGISIAKNLVEGLSSLTENLVKANESGNTFLGWFRELVKLDLALASRIPGPIGAAADAAAERLFGGGGGVGAMGSGPGVVRGRIRGATGGSGKPPPNPKAVACVVAGGKWVNNECIFPDKKGEAEHIAKQLAEDDEAWIQIQREADQATDSLMAAERRRERMVNIFGEEFAENKTTEQMEEFLRVMLEGIDATEEYEIRVGQLQGGFDGLGRAIEVDTRLAAEFGFTFQSAFEDAILSGEKLGVVINSLGKDIARMILRKAITEPIGNAITDSLIRSGFGGLFDFGGTASNDSLIDLSIAYREYAGDANAGMFVGAFAEGTDYVPRTGLALVHQGEKILRPGEGSGEGTTIVNINAIDAKSFVQLMATPAGQSVIRGAVERGYSRNGRRSGMAS